MPRSSRIGWTLAAGLCFFMFVFVIVPAVVTADLWMITGACGWLVLSLGAASIARRPHA